jgi:hypothetical protein
MQPSLETLPRRVGRPRRRGNRLPTFTWASFAVGFGLLFCCMSVFEGMIRWILSQADLEPLVYARDAFLGLSAACGFIHAYLRGYKTSVRLVVILAGSVALWTFIGHHFDHSWMQSLFGLKSYLPLFAGLLTSRSFFKSPASRSILWLLWMIAVAGVVLSALVDLPWKGAIYAIGDQEVEGQKEWTINGVDRLAGFARSSIDAAVQIGMLGVVLMRYSRGSIRAIVALASIGAIALTTARGELIGFVFGAATLLTCLSPWLRQFRKILVPMPLAPALAVMVCMYIPSSLDVIGHLGSTGMLTTDSFVARGEAIWKDAWDMQIHRGSIILGRGIGGIGAAQKLYEPRYYNPADNNFVFLVVTFGVAATFVITLLTLVYWTLSVVRTPLESALPLACAAVWFGIGVTSNCIEDEILMFFVAATWMPPEMLRRALPGRNAPLPAEEERSLLRSA